MSEIMIGDRVEFIGDDSLHAVAPQYYPKPGTIGSVAKIDPDGTLLVEWQEGSTSEDDTWFVSPISVRRVLE